MAVNPNHESTLPLLRNPANTAGKPVRLSNISDRRHTSIVRPLPAVDESIDESTSDLVEHSPLLYNHSPDIITDVPSLDESICQRPNTPVSPPPVTSGRRQTKFTVINYGAADALLSTTRSNNEDDDETDNEYAATASRSPSSVGIPIPVGSPGTRVRSGFIRDELPHHVRFRSSIAIADDLAAAGGAGGRFRPITVRQVSVDGGRVLVTTPRSPLNFAIVNAPPRLTTPPLRPSSAAPMRHPLATASSNAISSTSPSAVEVVLPPSRSPPASGWSGDASATERGGGGAGESMSFGGVSDEVDENTKTSAPDELGGRANGYWSTTSRWRWSGHQLGSRSSMSSSIQWPPIDCEKGDDDAKPPTANSSTGVFSDETSSVDGAGDGSRDVINVSKMKEVAKRGRLFAKRCKRRLVLQSGVCNVSYVNVERRGARFLLDFFTTLLEMKWRYNIVVYLVTFILTWLLFALLWWLVHVAHGADENGVTCVVGVDGFVTAFLFSVETQHTIGYGSRSITDRCPDAVFLLMLQSLFGAVTQCLVTGVIFAKMSRPKGRAETIVFSRKAVVYRNAVDGMMYLSFRVGDLRESQLIGVSINALLVRKQRIHCHGGGSGGGQHINLVQQRLRISTESGDDLYFLAWPIKLVHRIDETSPLWELSSEQLLVADFEILVVLEANCEATGSTVQVRTSYLPSDILWGHTLASLFTYQKENGRFKVDFSQFNNVAEVDMLEMSAKDVTVMVPTTKNNNNNQSSKTSNDTKPFSVNNQHSPLTSFHYTSDT